MIIGLLVGVLALDASRLRTARTRLPAPEWSEGIRLGVVAGALLLVFACLVWQLSRRVDGAKKPTEIVAAIVGIGVFGMSHPRHGDDVLTGRWSLGVLVAVDLLFAGALLYAAGRRWGQRPPAAAEVRQ
jgi:protein-S-isoprenylcysteine O-methyltransferase Ste14